MTNIITVYGTKICSDCRRSKQWLNDHNILFKEIFLEEDDNAIEFVIKVNNGLRSVPTIVFPDESIMIEPSNHDLEAKIKQLKLFN